ncbi:MAG: thiamine phosphate synthase [Coriobacteriaceae bacterium]|nr:thiamine phosphate synthase [Coriobacteriaceae bacterium]
MCRHVICVTDRGVVPTTAGEPTTEALLRQIERVAVGAPRCIVLREKDLDAEAYTQLATSAAEICRTRDVGLAVRGEAYTDLAVRLGCALHLSFEEAVRWFGFEEQDGKCPSAMNGVGLRPHRTTPAVSVSVHSIEEARALEPYDVDFLLAGHVFETDCKPGVPARGSGFFEDVVGSTMKPAFAIGGITPQTAKHIAVIAREDEHRDERVVGVAARGSLMRSDDPAALIRDLEACFDALNSHSERNTV